MALVLGVYLCSRGKGMIIIVVGFSDGGGIVGKGLGW